jgi:hypothetical protein
MSGSHVRRVLENHNIRTRTLRSPARAVRYVFRYKCSSHTVPFGGMGHVFVKCVLARRVRTDKGGLGVLEIAADSREVLGKAARYSSISMLTSSRPKGGSTTPTSRRTVATEVAARSSGGVIFKINRRRIGMCEGFE